MTDALLPTIWFCIIAFEVALYVLLDGADLGIGMLTLFPQKEEGRSLMMKTVGPIWDANETWLVIAGGTLFGAFPGCARPHSNSTNIRSANISGQACLASGACLPWWGRDLRREDY